MDGIEGLFSLRPLPCAFTVHSGGAVKRIGDGEPAFAVHLRNGQGWKALRSLDELTIAEAYVRGDIDIEGDEIRAMWLRGLLADDKLPEGASFEEFPYHQSVLHHATAEYDGGSTLSSARVSFASR